MKLVGVILAGGKSTRMGQDKALLRWKDDETFLCRQEKILNQVVGVEAVFVSGIREGYDCIPDIRQDCGPLEGIRSALVYLSHRFQEFGVYFVPVDMPFLNQRDLEKLSAGVESEDAVAFVNMNLPVLICNPLKALEALAKMELFKTGRHYSLKELYSYLKVKRIGSELELNLMNINTPEDFKNALSKTDDPS